MKRIKTHLHKERKVIKEGRNKNKIKMFIFSSLADFIDNCLFKIIMATVYLITHICVHMYVHTHMHLYVNEMNDSNDTRDGREELGLFYYYQVLTLSMK